MSRLRRSGFGVALAAVGVMVALLVVPMPLALAHEGEQNPPALQLVQQAIAIIRSQPELTDDIDDKINDAIESDEPAHVDIAKVEDAQKAFHAGDLSRTELLLEQSIGACPGEPVVSPQGIRTPPPMTSPCPAPAHLMALDRVPVTGTSRVVLLVLAALSIVAGLYLLRRTDVHAG